MKEDYLMRSLMFVPAHNTKLMDSSIKREADVLVLDLEDSVPVTDKQIARENIKAFVERPDLNDKLIFPRVNDRESGELLRDIHQLTVEGVHGFIYPKAQKAEDIYFFGKLLETIEYEKGYEISTFKIIPLIETAGAVVNIREICGACPSRIVAVAFGCEDYITSIGGQHDEEGQSIFTARSLIAASARACGIIPIDTVHIKVHDLENLEQNLKVAKKLGFEGMLVLNPKELPLVHQYFSPTNIEVKWAEEMIRTAKEAKDEGKGVTVVGTQFIGPPMVKMAQNILNKHKLITSKKSI
jgi:citrate lyase subunit beta/citryl-CoA lyase